MGKITLIHLSGPRRGEIDSVARLPAAIGSDPGSAVAIPGIAGTHALLVERQEMVVLADAGSEQGTLLLGEPVREATLRDGDVLPACAQTCPSDAIVFGTARDPEARVLRAKADPRAYTVFEQLNTRPGITYVQRVLHDGEG